MDDFLPTKVRSHPIISLGSAIELLKDLVVDLVKDPSRCGFSVNGLLIYLRTKFKREPFWRLAQWHLL